MLISSGRISTGTQVLLYRESDSFHLNVFKLLMILKEPSSLVKDAYASVVVMETE